MTKEVVAFPIVWMKGLISAAPRAQFRPRLENKALDKSDTKKYIKITG